MKYLAIILLVLFPINLLGTVYYAHPDGNNGDALSWATAKTFIGFCTELSGFANGDTIVCGGDGLGGGTMNHQSIIIDSLVHENGWEIGVTDTSMIWSSTLTGFPNAVAGVADGCKLIGLSIAKNQSTALTTVTMRDWKLYNCRFINNTANNEILRFGTGSADTTFFYNCLFIIKGAGRALYQTVAGNSVFINCTFYGRFSEGIRFNADSDEIIKNCIFQTTDGENLYVIGPAGNTHIYDYNIYFGNVWWWEVAITAFSVWVDSVNNYGAGNEVNSLYQDPTLQFVATTCVPLTSVSCPDIGYGDEIGWYQTSSAATKQGSIIPLIF